MVFVLKLGANILDSEKNKAAKAEPLIPADIDYSNMSTMNRLHY